jgi:histidine phosphotransfer protein HptB
VIPAHTLKSESRQFGAKRLGDLAEAIEKAARQCVEQHIAPTAAASEIAMLRGCFSETLAVLRGAPSTPNHPTTPAYQSAAARPSGARTFGRRIG